MGRAVSVVIPVHNGEHFIREAVQSALIQEGVEVEVVVVNDASRDNTLNILTSITDDRLVTIDLERNVGGAKARNIGVSSAKHDWIAFLDADDIFLPFKLTRQIDVLSASNTPSMAATNYWDHRGNLGIAMRGEQIAIGQREILTKQYDVPTSGWLLQRRDYEAIGGFTEQFPRHQDVEMLVRYLKFGKVIVLNEPLFSKRLFGRPAAATVEAALRLYFEQFGDAINDLSETDRRRLHARSCARLATLHMNEGNLASAARQCWTALVRSPPAACAWLARPLLGRIRAKSSRVVRGKIDRFVR